MSTSNYQTDRDPRLTSSQPAMPARARTVGMTEEEARDFEGFSLPPLPQRSSRTKRNNPPTNTTSSTPINQNADTSSNTTNTTNNNSTTNTNNTIDYQGNTTQNLPTVNPNPADNRDNMDTNTIQPTTNYILSNITSYKNDLLTKLLCPQGRAAPTTSNNYLLSY